MTAHASLAPTPPGARRTIRTSTSYQEAERTVDWLSDHGFAVEGATIVGSGLRYVEQVGGRLTTARAALAGAGQGAWIGLFISVLFSLFFGLSSGDYFGLLLYGIVTGTLFGALWIGLLHYLQRGRRDFSSIAQTHADHYEVQVDERVAGEAEKLLAQMPAAP